MENHKPTVYAAMVALVIALAAPLLWIVITGETRTTPVIERSFFEKMPQVEIDAWIEKNSQKASFWQHVQSSASYLADAWRGYALAASVIFVLIINGVRLELSRDRGRNIVRSADLKCVVTSRAGGTRYLITVLRRFIFAWAS